MALLTREAILGASDLRTVTVPVPEWGGDVILGEMSGVDRDDWEAGYMQRESAEKAAAVREKRPANPYAGVEMTSARMVVWTARTAEGGDLFLVRKPGGRVDHAATEVVVAQVAKRSGIVLTRLFDQAQALHGLGPKALEASEGNSGGTPGGGSGGKPA